MNFPPFTQGHMPDESTSAATLPNGCRVSVMTSTTDHRVDVGIYGLGVRAGLYLAADEALAIADVLQRAARLCTGEAAPC